MHGTAALEGAESEGRDLSCARGRRRGTFKKHGLSSGEGLRRTTYLDVEEGSSTVKEDLEAQSQAGESNRRLIESEGDVACKPGEQRPDLPRKGLRRSQQPEQMSRLALCRLEMEVLSRQTFAEINDDIVGSFVIEL
jgi:hypothetical protein